MIRQTDNKKHMQLPLVIGGGIIYNILNATLFNISWWRGMWWSGSIGRPMDLDWLGVSGIGRK